MASILLAAPQREELEALVSGFHARRMRFSTSRVGRLDVISVPALDMLMIVAGHGKVQFGVQVQHLIERCPELKVVICTGAAGRLNASLAFGDVVVATETIEHDYKLRFVSAPLPRFGADSNCLADLRRVALGRRFPFKLHFGPIASGDEDVTDVMRGTEIRNQTDALCVAWEGSGGARACRFSGIGFLEIRVVTDAADHEAAKSFHENVAIVMPRLAELFIAWKEDTGGRLTNRLS